MAYSRSISLKSSFPFFLLFSLAVHLVVIAAVRDLGIKEELIEIAEPGKVILKLLQAEKPPPPPPVEIEESKPDEATPAAEPAAVPVSAEKPPVEAQKDPPVTAPTPVPDEPKPSEIPVQEEAAAGEQPMETVEIARISIDPPASPEKPSEDASAPEEQGPAPILGSFTAFGSGAGGSTGPNTDDRPVSQPVGREIEAVVPFDSLSDGAVIPKPVYPDLARRWGHEGVAVVRIYVNSDGTVAEAVLLSTSGHQVLDDAALWTVERRWKFKPAGRQVTTVKEFEFKLER